MGLCRLSSASKTLRQRANVRNGGQGCSIRVHRQGRLCPLCRRLNLIDQILTERLLVAW